MKTLFLVTEIRAQAWDASKLMNAQAQWSEHATFMNRLAADGFVVLGGPVGETGEVLLIIDAADEGEIRGALSRDPWIQSGIIDVKTIQLWTILLQAGEER